MNFDDFNKVLADYSTPAIVFVCLGNKYRGDDGAALYFLDKLKGTEKYKNSHFINAGTNPENHLQEIINYKPQLVLFVDIYKNNSINEKFLFINSEQVNTSCTSTHTFSIKLIEDYLKLSDEMEVKYLGIKPDAIITGDAISENVQKRIDEFFIDSMFTEYEKPVEF